VIGGVFLAIVLFSPNGLIGIWTQLRSRLGSRTATNPRRRLR
jgi:branched-chain amino acid transport system permease protein